MAVAIGAILAAAGLVVLMVPFLRKIAPRVTGVGDPIQELRQERNALYQETRILRQDFDLGHFSEEEYQARFQTNRLRAATLLRRQDELEAMNRQLEEEILALRKVPSADDEARRCFECRREVSSTAQQCSHCGALAPGGGLSSLAEGEE